MRSANHRAGLKRARPRCELGESVARSSSAESQRDSAPKPRVARDELPWGKENEESNPERVVSLGHRKNGQGCNSVGVAGGRGSLPNHKRQASPCPGGTPDNSPTLQRWAILGHPSGMISCKS